MADATSSENLKREITPFSLGMAIVNIAVGSGIFILPAVVADGLGATAMLAYLACGVVMFCIGLCFAELGSKTTNSGGIYTYIETSFGPFAGFLASNLYIIGACVTSDAAISNALADTLSYLFPQLQQGLYRTVFHLMVFGLLAYINIRSVKYGLRFVLITSLGKLIPLFILVLIAAPSVRSTNLTSAVSPSFGNISAAALLLYFAFLGVEAPLSNGGEMKHPSRTVPLGIFIGVGIVLLLYVSIQLVSQGILGNELQGNKAPLAAVANQVIGSYGHLIIVCVIAISMLGSLAGEILSIPRILFAGARDGLLPKVFTQVHPRYATPHVSIAAYSLAGCLLALTSGFRQLAIIATAAALILYLGVAIATIKNKLSKKLVSEKTFRIAGGITVPLIAAAAIIWMLASLTRIELTGLLIFLTSFSAIYWTMYLMKRRQLQRTIIEREL